MADPTTRRNRAWTRPRGAGWLYFMPATRRDESPKMCRFARQPAPGFTLSASALNHFWLEHPIAACMDIVAAR